MKKTLIRNGHFTAQINGLNLWYKVSGNGPVCIHPTPGWGPSSELYFLGFTPLEAMFTMVYLDTRGSGRSQRPELDGYTMGNFAADIEGLRQYIGEDKIWLIGHSDGGMMVLHYARINPDHVLGLILVDTTVENTSLDEGRSKRMKLRQGEAWFDAAIQQWEKWPKTQEEFDTYHKTVLPFFFSSIENLEKHKEVFNQTSMSFHAAQGQQYSESMARALVSWLPEMDIPTFIIVGRDDFVCPPSSAQILHEMIPNSVLIVIEKAGHFPWLEQPDQFFGGINNFLSGLV